VVSGIAEMFEADKSYQFLLGLNDDLYSQIRSQVLATKSLSSEKIHCNPGRAAQEAHGNV